MYKEFANIYDGLIKKDFNYEKMTQFILNKLKENNVELENYLDNGTGTGTCAKIFSKYFKRVVASDISYEMITQASSKFTDEENMPIFMVKSAEDVLITDGFNLITSVMDIPNYLGRRKFIKYLRNSYTSLKPNGLLIFDVSSKYKLDNVLGDETYIYDEEDVYYVWNNKRKLGLNNPYIDIDITFFVYDEELDKYDRINEYQKMYYLNNDFIIEEATKIGFEVVSINDDYEDKKADDKTLRITYVLRRK